MDIQQHSLTNVVVLIKMFLKKPQILIVEKKTLTLFDSFSWKTVASN